MTDLQRVRTLTNETDETTYTDADIAAMLLEEPSVEAVIARIWREKASKYAELVNMNDAGVSRSLGDLYKNALEMARQYEAIAGTVVTDLADRPRTRAITRP